MADSIERIAPVVIIPQTAPETGRSASAKRRQSAEPGSSSKRPRVSEEPIAPSQSTLRASPLAAPETEAFREKAANLNSDRQKSSIQEERKRGQRLFGGLLSTLSQSTSNGQQKRRLEIEKRQQEKVKQQKTDDEVRRVQKLESLAATRKVEQIKFNASSMRIRHTNILAMAQFLCTKMEPKLYYKPWELLPGDEERIKTQVTDAKALIKQEEDEFSARYPDFQITRSSTDGETNNTSSETVGEPQIESSSTKIDNTNDTPVLLTDQGTSEKHAMEEHNGEVVVENEEDTVIY